MDRLLLKLHYTQHVGTLHQHSDHFILGQDTFANFAKPNGGAALLATCTVCLSSPLNPCPTHTLAISSLRQDVIQYFIYLRWQGVTEFAFQTKYATTNSNRDTGSTGSHCAFEFINQVFFFPKGCQAGQLCEVPEAMWWPVCVVQYELFPGSTRLISFLVRQTIPKRKEKHTLPQSV